MSANPVAIDEAKQKTTEKNAVKSASSPTVAPPLSADDEISPEIAALSQLSISEPAAEPSPPTVPPNWTLWRYECRDLPGHKCFTKPCPFCAQVNKLGGVAKGKQSESTDRWDSYLKRERTYEDEQTVAKALDRFLPSKLAKDVFFDRKLGVALFRGDIEPKSESAENVNGIVFQLLLLATSGRKSVALVSKFDALFSHAIRLTFALPHSVGCHVNGIFLRCEMNPGKGLQSEANPYGNLMDLPFMTKLEVWTRDQSNKASVWAKLIMEVQKKVDELGIPSTAHRQFITINRVENWAKTQKFAGTAPFGIKKPFQKHSRNCIVAHRNEN